MPADSPCRLFLASSSEVYGKNPKAVLDGRRRFGVRAHDAGSLVIWRLEGHRRILGAGLAWRQERLPVVVGRLFNVVGPTADGTLGDGPAAAGFAAALAGRPLMVHDDGRQQRCFAHVADVVRAILGLMQTAGGDRRRVQYRQRSAD